jgi:KDO2-lipid IV(A) lauroyltransferase
MYYIVYGFFYLVSLLPWFVLHGIADFLTVLVFYVFGYRKEVVLKNLAVAFPEKTQKERNKIAFEFYRLFIDTLVETIKIVSLSEKQLAKRFTGDVSIINEVLAEGRSLQIHAMHNFNWEIVNLNISRLLNFPFLGVYMPISNPIFERIITTMRKRYGTILLPAPHFKREFLKYNSNPYILALVADQHPSSPENAFWLPFFGKLTPFAQGPEKGARANETAVLFGHFFPTKRGHYGFTCKLITRNAATLPEGEITRQYVAYLEESIRLYPANYLWSHRRWKVDYNKDLHPNLIG